MQREMVFPTVVLGLPTRPRTTPCRGRCRPMHHIRTLMATAGGDDARREAARVLAEASERKRTKLNSTGTVVLKAAVVAVLGAQCAQTTQLLFSTATKGTLTVRYAAPEKPTDAQVSFLFFVIAPPPFLTASSPPSHFVTLSLFISSRPTSDSCARSRQRPRA